MIPLNIQPGQRLYFWGWGPLLTACYEELCSMVGRTPDAILDSDGSKSGKQLSGVPCLHPNALLEAVPPVIVITARKHQPIVAAIREYMPAAQVYVGNFQIGFHKSIGLVAASDLQSATLISRPLPSLQGKRALVTGATKGIGRAVSMKLAEMGLDLVLVSRSELDLASLAATLSTFSIKVQTICADLATEPGLQALLQHPVLAHQTVDVVYNNAAVSFPLRPLITAPMSYEQMRHGYALNVIAPVAIAEHFLRLATPERPVRIINVSSNADTPENSAYTLTKAALNRYSYDSFDTYARHHAALYLFDPGDVQTSMNPAGYRPVESIFPAVLIPLYCRAQGRISVLHATELAGMDLSQSIDSLLNKYPEQWQWEPM